MDMNKIDMQLKTIKESNRLGLMTHVVVGYPSLQDTKDIVTLMAENGADFVELQIPFSDPLADGPTIMRACETSLQNGTKVKDAFALMQILSKKVSIPLLFMAYYNTVFKYGVKKFCKDAASSGAAGLIVPDMSIDEEDNENFYATCDKYNLYAIHVVSPASTDERLRKNAKVAKGFVYATARQGITGAREKLSENPEKYLGTVKRYIKIPIAVGFGISKNEHIKIIEGKAELAVIGSKIIDIINNSIDYKKDLQNFLRHLSGRD